MSIRKVVVVPFKIEWAELFNKEKQQLIDLMKPREIVLHHIGSTSVPGLSAKPIVDILGEVNSLDILDELTLLFEQKGYQAKGENGIAGRRYFLKLDDNGERLIHLHTFEKGNPEIARHLVFRDYLRQHPEEAKRYEEVKVTAAKKFPYDIESYINFKDSIVKELEKKALAWKNAK